MTQLFNSWVFFPREMKAYTIKRYNVNECNVNVNEHSIAALFIITKK